METSFVQSAKLALLSALGLSRDALHICVGLGVYLVVSVVTRKSLRSSVPWVAVLVVAVVGEGLDMRDDLASFGHWRWASSLFDIVNTALWLSLLFLLARLKVIRTGH